MNSKNSLMHHKYLYKKNINGRWRYYYDDSDKRILSINRTFIKVGTGETREEYSIGKLEKTVNKGKEFVAKLLSRLKNK